MGSNWTKTTIGEYCPFIYGKSLPARERNETGPVPVFGSGGLSGFHDKSLVSSAGVIIGRKGTVGSVIYSEQPFWPIDTTFYITKASVDELKFAYYLLQTLGLNKLNSDSAVPGLNRDEAHSIKFNLPPEKERAVIAKYLTSLDNKITLNRQINQTLEQMAQALFKSWFVDFDPVVDNALDAGFFEQNSDLPEELLRRAEQRKTVRQQPDFKPLPAETRQLFPAAFEECEEPSLGLGGWVPKGWNITSSGKQIDVRDGTHDSPMKSEFGFPLVTSKNLTSGRLDLTNAYLISEMDYNEVNKRSNVEQGDILLTMIGTLGIPCLVSTKNVCFAIKNVGLFKTSKTPQIKMYFFELLKSKGMQAYLESRSAGTTQRYLSLKVLRNISFILPNIEVLSKFNNFIDLNEHKSQQNDEQNAELTNIRDMLLPKLISGELRLSDDGTLTSGNTDC